jgi:hypothetical protein
VSMPPVCRRPAAALRRPAAALPAALGHQPPVAVVAAPVPFDVASWAQTLDLGPELDGGGGSITVYLGTFSRVLAATLAASPQLRDPSAFTREQIRDAVLDAWGNPLPSVAGGRPRVDDGSPVVSKMLVVRERHVDGAYHFHVAVKLGPTLRFGAAKRTLMERHGLVSHWSSTHTQWWTALRYCLYTNPPKKMEVDDHPLPWSAPDVTFDAFREAQEGYLAKAWTKRREDKDTTAPARDERATFSKLDFLALVEDKGLKSRKRVLAYVQAYGTAAERSFCAKHQRRLDEYLEDAVEWSAAQAAAALEQKSDWDLLCLAADGPCPRGDGCIYRQAASSFFEAHKGSFTETRLAASLRSIIVAGPSKERRVPFLVGTTNTGKSTIVESFDALYGEDAVFHLPAETDNKGGALRGWLHGKRLVFWDEFEPVVFIAKGVMPKSQFLKAFNGQLFEIQMNQRTNDGNKPFRWNRGAVFTAKERDLWKLRDGVTSEDVAHIKSRVELFRCSGEITMRPGGVPQCAHCMAKWIRHGAAKHDADALRSAEPVDAPAEPGTVNGLQALLHAANVPVAAQSMLAHEILSLGAIDVRELRRADWEALNSWRALREMERRRVLEKLSI